MNKYILFFFILFQFTYLFSQTYEEIIVLHKKEKDINKRSYYAVLLLMDHNTKFNEEDLLKEIDLAAKKSDLGKALKNSQEIVKKVVSNFKLPELKEIRISKAVLKKNGYIELYDNLEICEAYVLASNKDFAAASLKYDQIYERIKKRYLKKRDDFLPSQSFNLITMSIAFHYFTVGEHEKAVEYIDDLIQLTNIKKHPIEYALVLNNAGTAFLSSSKYDEALKYYNLSQKILTKENSIDDLNWNTYCISLVKLRQGKNKEALILLNAIQLHKIENGVEYNFFDKPLVDLAKSEIYLEANKLDESEKLLNPVLELIGENYLNLKDEITAYKLKYLLSKKQGNIREALKYHEIWSINELKALNERRKDNIKLQAKFLDLEKSRISESFQKMALKREKEIQFNNQLKMIALLIVGILIIGLFLIRYIRISKSLADLNSENQIYTSKVANSLSEKEVMLKEIHHRVKNNFQIISSLLNIQANSLENETHVNPLIEAKNRIYSMSLVHQKMYSDNANYISINFKTYLEELLETLHGSYGGDRIKLKKNFDIHMLDITLEKAVPIGLFCNEVFTNAYKYAVDSNNELSLHVSLKRNGDKAILYIRDEGPGVDYNKAKSSSSIGQQLKEILSQQIEGKLNEYNENGAVVELEFLL